MNPRPPLPPFTEETARQKVQAAEDAWNSRDPERVALAYTVDTHWRNRTEFLHGRAEVVAFLRRKWQRELDYRLKKELWAFGGNRIAVRFEYEYHNDTGQWYRAHGNENWEFDELGYMKFRYASINDQPIASVGCAGNGKPERPPSHTLAVRRATVLQSWPRPSRPCGAARRSTKTSSTGSGPARPHPARCRRPRSGQAHVASGWLSFLFREVLRAESTQVRG